MIAIRSASAYDVPVGFEPARALWRSQSRTNRALCAAIIASGFALFPLVASSQPTHAPSRTGFEPSAHIGYGGFVGGLNFPGAPAWAVGTRGPSIAVDVHLGYRIARSFSTGIHVEHQWLTVDGLPAQTTAVATAASGGVYARLHPLGFFERDLPIDLHIGAGFDFLAYGRQTTRTTDAMGGEVETRNAAPGIAVPLSLGLDVVFGDFAVGVLGTFAPWWSTEACAGIGTGLPVCQPRTALADDYFFIGLGFRALLRFVR
jgi:hypothetical protein